MRTYLVNISAQSQSGSELEIGHVLFMDVVGYSKLLINEQKELQQQLNQVVRGTEQFRLAEAAGKLIRLPTGDGMALVFFNSPESPAKCALEIGKALNAYPRLKLRMGIHSGPVSGVADVNDRSNVAGAGINVAQRVMDCGDAGHILLTKRAADDLAQEGRWQPHLHQLGEISVKHGVPLSVVNLYTGDAGNPELPAKIKLARQQQTKAAFRRRILIAGAIILLGALAALLVYKRQPIGTATNVLQKSIAVLPLENLSDEKENAYFADGVQDELLSNLAKIRDLKVISRTSVMQYKTGISRNLKEIAQQLGVTNVVEGSVRRSGNHLRVSVQLIDALTDRHLWAQNYDRTVADSVALQGELATQIASEVGATISPQEKARVQATPTTNTAAYDAYLRGRALAAALTPDQSNMVSAAQSFQQAVNSDPGFALAWAYLSCAHSWIYWNADDHSAARLAAAKEAADRAVALDPNLAEIHLALGYYHYYGLIDFKGALVEFQTAEQGLPNNTDVLRAISLIQRRLGHWDEAIATSRRVVELDPRELQSAGILGYSYMAKRRFSDALAMADHILAVEPSNLQGIGLKMNSLWALGNIAAVDSLLANPAVGSHIRGHQAIASRRFSEAVDLFSKALKEEHNEDMKRNIYVDLGFAQQRAGNVAESKAAYETAVQGFTQVLNNEHFNTNAQSEWHSRLGIAYAGLGNSALAISEGKKGMMLGPTSDDLLDGPLREQDMAIIYASLGNADEAIPILKRWVQVSSSTDITPSLLRIDPYWDPIRNDPRFQELLAEPQSKK